MKERKVSVSVSLTLSDMQYLNEIGDGSPTAGVRALLATRGDFTVDAETAENFRVLGDGDEKRGFGRVYYLLNYSGNGDMLAGLQALEYDAGISQEPVALPEILQPGPSSWRNRPYEEVVRDDAAKREAYLERQKKPA